MRGRRDDMSVREAVHCAERALAELDIDSLPIDPLDIAARKGITVSAQSLDGCSGCLVKSGDAFGILYSDALQNEGFERFTVSHELGHYFIPGHPEALFGGGNNTHRSRSGFVSRDPHERQADNFAASLLMPKKLFVAAARADSAEGFATIENIAVLCKASITATALRFARLAEDPVAVVMSEGNKIQWCEMSSVLYGLRGLTWLGRGSLLPRESASARFNTDTSNITRCAKVESTSLLSDWFDGAPDVEVMEDVVGLGRYGRTLTVLFSRDAIDDESEEGD